MRFTKATSSGINSTASSCTVAMIWTGSSRKAWSRRVNAICMTSALEPWTGWLNPHPNWDPFIRARNEAVTGATAKTEAEVSDVSIPFKIPARELPVAQAHPETTTELKLRITRGDEALEGHEKANCVAVFRGAEMVVKYVPPKRKPLDSRPIFGVLYAGKAVGSGAEESRAEEFFRASEPPLHENWEDSQAVKHAYKTGGKLRLSVLWNTLQEKVFALIDENVVPDERGPDMLAKLFPFGQSSKAIKKKHAVKTTILDSTYLGGQWKVKGDVTRVEPDGKVWEARIG